MKELDVLLETFLVVHEQSLRTGDWPQLESLMDFEDDRLWDCLRQEGNSPEPDFALLAETIRSARHPDP